MYDFKNITGHENIIANLKNSIINNRINHAYIFEGEEGIGKTLIANSFAKALLCENGEEGNICGKCSSCLSFDSNNNPDIIYVKPAKTKSIGVDDIRQQVSMEIALKPYKYKYKIFIIENADTMTPSAQNALLKTLEEPAVYGVFLLMAVNIDFLLPTVLSRCFTVNLKPLRFDDVKNYLINKIGLTEEKAHFISIYASGSIGRAVSAAEDTNFAGIRSMVISVLDHIDQKDLADVFALAKGFEAIKDSMSEALNIGFLWYRDIAVLKEFGDTSLVLQKDIINDLTANTYIDTETIYKNIEVLWDAKNSLRYNANFQLTTEVLLMKLNSPC